MAQTFDMPEKDSVVIGDLPPPVSGYIDVREQLPKPMTRVLAFVTNRIPHEVIAYIREGSLPEKPVWSIYDTWGDTTSVAYWQPLPPEPEGWFCCGEGNDGQ